MTQRFLKYTLLAVICLTCGLQLVFLFYADFQTYQIPVDIFLEKKDIDIKEYRVEGSVKPNSISENNKSFEICANNHCIKATSKDSLPQNLKENATVILIGKMHSSTFQAREILVRCPTKYTNDPTQKHPDHIKKN